MRCPVCKADNPQGPQCRRCKGDLTLLFALEEQRQSLLAAAQRALLDGSTRQAVEAAEQADWLRGDSESCRLLALAHLLERQFGSAWEYYLQVAPSAQRMQ
jgi:hypothetical protein